MYILKILKKTGREKKNGFTIETSLEKRKDK